MSVLVKSGMVFKVVMMTPVWATELLKNNHPRNRSKKWGKISSFARDMAQGYWRLTHQPIAVDVHGRLIDGQNRLEAVVESGCEVPFVLVTGCEADSILGADIGSSRTVCDMSRIQGEAMVTDYPGVVRRMMLGFKSTPWPTHAEVLHYARVHQAALLFSFECLPKSVRGLTQAPVRAVIARSYYRRMLRTRTREFCNVLISGLPERAKEDSGALRLRNWLQDTFLGGKRGAGKRARQEVVYGMAERMLTAFHNSECVARAEATTKELFPVPGDPSVEEVEEEMNG